jgi:hypothetical protein
MIAIAFETVFWWALMVGVWELTLSGTTLPEIYCEVAAAFLAAVAAVATRRALGGRWLPKPSWARWLPVLAASVVADTTRVLTLAVQQLRSRQVPSRFDVVQLQWPRAVEPETHRAYATLTLTGTPGSLVYHDEPDSHRLCLHTLVSGPPDLRRMVAK